MDPMFDQVGSNATPRSCRAALVKSVALSTVTGLAWWAFAFGIFYAIDTAVQFSR